LSGWHDRRKLAIGLGLVLSGACAPALTVPPSPPVAGLPPIAAVDGPLDIRVVHPTPATVRPNVDSTFIYGSLGTGRATLTINGVPVEVRPNGAFLGFLPVPRDGGYELVAEARGARAHRTVAYREPAPAGAASAPATLDFTPARLGVVTGGADTLATGSDAVAGQPTPTGTYRWFLPRGARLEVTGQRGNQYRVRMDTATAWVAADAVTLGMPQAEAAAQPVPNTGAAIVPPQPGWIDVHFGAEGAPFLARALPQGIEVTIYGRNPPAAETLRSPDPLIRSIDWVSAGPRSARATLHLGGPAWGYKAFYTPGGDLVIRVRRPPRLDPADPLRGLRIAIDPGHPPGGATGPTGLSEAEANLAISLRLRDQLRARGADVIMTRTDNVAVGLSERVQVAVAADADLLVSVHNNAFPEGVNPFRSNGTSVYSFHPFSAPLSEALNRHIVATTRIRDLGARWSNLALTRPTWMPSALTESLFMLIPEQEAALRDPVFLEQLAAAHVRGIEEFVTTAVRTQP
jgi:N-acetylmuramoyl-L-alanine amidase